MSRYLRLGARPLVAAAVALVATPLAAQSLQHDSDLPIEITADSLEVVQDQQLATFVGNVDAVQGDLVLSADELRVHYRPRDEGGDGSIRRIEAIGNVFVTSPRETAQGEVGVYDVPGGVLTLEGSVVLTRDANVIRGERLEYDLASGRSRVVAGRPAAEGAAPGERVRAIFTPAGAAAPAAGGGGPAADAATAAGNQPGPRAAAPPAPRPADAE